MKSLLYNWLLWKRVLSTEVFLETFIRTKAFVWRKSFCIFIYTGILLLLNRKYSNSPNLHNFLSYSFNCHERLFLVQDPLFSILYLGMKKLFARGYDLDSLTWSPSHYLSIDVRIIHEIFVEERVLMICQTWDAKKRMHLFSIIFGSETKQHYTLMALW